MKIDPSLRSTTQLLEDFKEKFTEERDGHHIVKKHPYLILQWLRVAFKRVREEAKKVEIEENSNK